jgi:hypothetical protein
VHSKSYVQAELSFDHQFVFIVADATKDDHFFICLARSPLEERHRVRTDRITKLPAIAVYDLAYLFSDHVRRSWLGQRRSEQSPLTAGMRVRTVIGRWLCFGENRRSDYSRFYDRYTDIERLHFLREALAQCLKETRSTLPPELVPFGQRSTLC